MGFYAGTVLLIAGTSVLTWQLIKNQPKPKGEPFSWWVGLTQKHISQSTKKKR